MTLLHQAAQKAVEALTLVTTSETFYRDPRGDRAGPAIDALVSALQQQPEPVATEEAAYQRGKRAGYIDGYRAAHADERQQPDISPALQHQEEPREQVAWPPEVIAWRDARREYVEALERYNTRLAAIRAREAQLPHEFGHDNPEAEYHAYTDAQNRAHRLLGPMYEALMAASPSTTRQQEVGSEPYCTHGYKRGRDFCPYCDVAAAPSTPEKAGGVPVVRTYLHASRVDTLIAVMEGECDGLAVTRETAEAILHYLDGNAPPDGVSAVAPVRLVEGPPRDFGQAQDRYGEHMDRPAPGVGGNDAG